MNGCKTIAICNQKGGVGKTTTALNLGVGLAKADRRVLLIDADPQSDLTSSLGWEGDKPKYSKLKKGDVLVKSTHVAMYIGKGKMVEASGGNWSARSIATKKMSNSKYKGFSYVMRYTGY